MKCGACGLDVAYRLDTGHKERNVIVCPNCRTVKMWRTEYQAQQERQAEKDNQALDAMRRDIVRREGQMGKRAK